MHVVPFSNDQSPLNVNYFAISLRTIHPLHAPSNFIVRRDVWKIQENSSDCASVARRIYSRQGNAKGGKRA
jgi:hypothetical protein